MQLSASEQLYIELINRARLDPGGEALRQGVAISEGLAPDRLSAHPLEPLAPDAHLIAAARAHSQWLIDSGQIAARALSHSGAGGSSPGELISRFARPDGGDLVFHFAEGHSLRLVGGASLADPQSAILL